MDKLMLIIFACVGHQSQCLKPCFPCVNWRSIGANCNSQSQTYSANVSVSLSHSAPTPMPAQLHAITDRNQLVSASSMGHRFQCPHAISESSQLVSVSRMGHQRQCSHASVVCALERITSASMPTRNKRPEQILWSAFVKHQQQRG